MSTKTKNRQDSESLAKKALAERLAIRLKKSISTLRGVLRKAKQEGTNIPDACRKLGMHPNYANASFHFLNSAERKNGLRLEDVRTLERLRDSIKTRNGGNGTRKTERVEGVSDSRKSGTGIENAIAGMRHAVENKMSMQDASLAIGKAGSFLSMSVARIDRVGASEEQREKLRNLHAEYKRMVSSGEIRPKSGQRRRYRVTRQTRNAVKPSITARSENSNALRHLSESGNVEYKYPLVTDRPVRKIQKAYPLELMKPGHSFSVPATKGEMKAARKAVTVFAKKTGTKFVQAKEGRELVFWMEK